MPPRLPSRLSWKLSAAILPPVVLAVSGIVWFQYQLAREQILTAIDRQIHFLAQKTAGDVDGLLDQRYRDLFTLAETSLIADYYRNVDFRLTDEAAAYRQELDRYLRNFAARSRVYARVLYLDARGRPVCGVGGRRRDAGLRAADFASAARRPADGWWISPIEDLAGVGPVVYYAKPVRDEFGTVKGMMVLAYDLAELRALLGNIEVGKRGRAYLLASDGRAIGAREGRVRDEEVLTASSPLRRRPWTVVVEAPRDDFLGPLLVIRNAAALTSLLGAALLIVILLLVVRSITRPIAELVVAARRIGVGDLSWRIRDPGGDELGLLGGAFNEMAERLDANRKQNAQLQSQLIQAEKLSAVGQLISAVAHELNNPLAAVSGYVQIALLDGCPPGMREDLGRVYHNVLRCRKVVDNLLFFVRQSGHERKKVPLNQAVRSALELLEYRLRKTEDVQVVERLDPDGPEVVGDLQQIVQVLVNLIGNACDAMESVVRYPAGKRLTIRTGCRDGRAFLEIEDNGAGVAPDLREKIFQPFFTTKEPGKGTGLGLPICRQIARDHGGDVTVDGRPGEGSVFRVEMPVGRAEELGAAAEEPIAREAVPGRRVLVADDETDVAEVIARVLREDGDQAFVAHNGAEALKLIASGSYDLMISDIEMEHAKGMDLYAALAAKGELPSCRVLFVTGDILNPKVLEFLSQTKSEYLVKPFDVAELQQAARRLLAGAAAPPR